MRLRSTRGVADSASSPSLTGGVTALARSSRGHARAREPQELELHPQYDMAAQLDELFSVPLYRQPENPLIESWREIGERLLALGERNLIEGVEAAGAFLEAKLEERRRRRLRRAARRRAIREAQAARAAQSAC